MPGWVLCAAEGDSPEVCKNGCLVHCCVHHPMLLFFHAAYCALHLLLTPLVRILASKARAGGGKRQRLFASRSLTLRLSAVVLPGMLLSVNEGPVVGWRLLGVALPARRLVPFAWLVEGSFRLSDGIGTL